MDHDGEGMDMDDVLPPAADRRNAIQAQAAHSFSKAIEENIDWDDNEDAQQFAEDYDYPIDSDDEDLENQVPPPEALAYVASSVVAAVVANTRRTSLRIAALWDREEVERSKPFPRNVGNDLLEAFIPSLDVSTYRDPMQLELMKHCNSLERDLFMIRKSRKANDFRTEAQYTDDGEIFEKMALEDYNDACNALTANAILMDYSAVDEGEAHPQIACKKDGVSSSSVECDCASCSDREPPELESADVVTRATASFAGLESRWPMSEEVKAFVEIACDESFAAPKRQIPDTLLNPAPSKKTATIADLVSKLKDLGAVHNFPRVALVNILTTLKDMTDLNLPFKVNGTTGKLVPVIDDYVETDVRNNTIDACINECMLYIGEHRTDIHCTRCFLPRYTKCHFGKCSDENCSPFINTSHTYRSANQVVIYRSLLIRLVEMCKKAVSGNPMFDYNATRRKVDGEMSDVLDGAAAVSHLFDMHSQFEKMPTITWITVVLLSLVCFYRSFTMAMPCTRGPMTVHGHS